MKKQSSMPASSRVRERSRARERSPFERGTQTGYAQGYEKGYQVGVARGRSEARTTFDGTSIVIVTCNQAESLMWCLDSIAAHTPETHEIIVMDNGSFDNTEERLRARSETIRYRRSQSRLDFAAAVNQGVKLARGKYIALLNCESIVTERWLRKLLECLQAQSRDCLVGPRMMKKEETELSNESVESEAHVIEPFTAEQQEELDPLPWMQMQTLCRLCVLMRRETIERLGYFDEGLGGGGREDDDFGLRALLLGRELILAKDAFIHSAVIFPDGRTQDSRFADKWGDPVELLEDVRLKGNGAQLRSIDLYPTHMIVKGPGGAFYWIEHGVRHPIEGEWPYNATRLSQLDLRQYASGAPIKIERLLERLATLSSEPSPYGPLAEGGILLTDNGDAYQSDRGTVRRFIGSALKAWGLERRLAYTMGADTPLPIGLPIMAPPTVADDL